MYVVNPDCKEARSVVSAEKLSHSIVPQLKSPSALKEKLEKRLDYIKQNGSLKKNNYINIVYLSSTVAPPPKVTLPPPVTPAPVTEY